jgi:acetyl/propionyl-CoA carboxylase alpha subunit
VENKADFEEQMKMAINEAQAAFGDGSVFIEKFVTKPRHIEIQILADNFGNIVYLFERECSIQRRHQKLVEEAPSAVLSEELRKKMGESAVFVAKACNYSGAGTVEFLLDVNHNFYFLEMNTRLQVEHPVSELITGIDLVKEQINVAKNMPLTFTQDDLKINGHAIELRVCAEDPRNNFLPEIGTLEVYKKPNFPFVRVDDGLEEGMEIPVFYDPMIAKLIVHGSDRLDAIEKMKQAIDAYHIVGLPTTLEFGKFVMSHPNFINGDFDTNFIKDHFDAKHIDFQLNDDEKNAIAKWITVTI